MKPFDPEAQTHLREESRARLKAARSAGESDDSLREYAKDLELVDSLTRRKLKDPEGVAATEEKMAARLHEMEREIVEESRPAWEAHITQRGYPGREAE